MSDASAVSAFCREVVSADSPFSRSVTRPSITPSAASRAVISDSAVSMRASSASSAAVARVSSSAKSLCVPSNSD